MKKAPETLADWLHAWTYDDRPVFANLNVDKEPFMVIDRTTRERQAQMRLDLRMALRKAERVTLDDAFMYEIAKKTIAGPTEVLAMTGLAMLPFEKMFVEWDDNVRVRAVAAAAKEIGGNYEFDETADHARAGLLFERRGTTESRPGCWGITHVSSSPGSLPLWPIAAAFDIDGFKSLGEDLELNQHPFVQDLKASAWGYVDDKNPASRTHYAVHEELMERGAATVEDRFFLPIMSILADGHKALPPHHSLPKILSEAAYQVSGKLRWAVAILASLNTVPIVKVPRVATGSFTYRARTVSRLSTVHVRIDAHPGHEVGVYDRAMREATGRHNRRHEVRGHWRVVDTRKKGVGSSTYWLCAHVATEVDPPYAMCGKCGHLLRWIDHHERGDASLGYVMKDGYDVKG